MTFGFSRDDAGKFLPAYYDKKIYEEDPFKTLDQTGVGKLIEMAARSAVLGLQYEKAYYYSSVGLTLTSNSQTRISLLDLKAFSAFAIGKVNEFITLYEECIQLNSLRSCLNFSRKFCYT